ncbi:MAG: tetratricopeptide repeat protein [Gammaproteobacteria bacterium]
MASAPGFPDRRADLFGRELDIEHLIARAKTNGLTAVVGRPQMGKTWVFIETARRLVEDQRCIVGYHEAKAAEHSHLLYTVRDLYTRWLADSNLRAQARSLWKRHKGDLVTTVGQAAGYLFGKLNEPEALGNVVRDAFDKLAEAQRDLRSGGLTLAPLPYDQARDLVRLVAMVSGRRVVLVLDAWEQSISVGPEHRTLESALDHAEEWPDSHLFLGIREPHLDRDAGNDAYRAARDLEDRSPAAEVYALPPMHLDEDEERRRMLGHVRVELPAAQRLAPEDLLNLVDGFPGVVSRWLHPAKREKLNDRAALEQAAADAQDYRYREFERLWPNLSPQERVFAARLAFLHRLDESTWPSLKEVLVVGLDGFAWHPLVGKGVLANDTYPSYGHDTRHAAARRWVERNTKALIRDEGKIVVQGLAGRIVRADEIARPYAEALVFASPVAEALDMPPASRCLTWAAASLFGLTEPLLSPAFDTAWRAAITQDPSVAALISLALNNRGVTKGQLGDSAGEMADYTAVIEMPNAPPDQITQALNNRGVRKGQLGDSAGAMADFTAVIEMPNAPPDQIADALYNRGVTKGQFGNSAGEMADYTAVIEMPNALTHQIAQALNNRGITKGELGDSAGEMADFTTVIEMPNAPPDQITKALNNRGVRKGQLGDSAGEMADYTAVIEMPNAPPDQIAKALNNRGITKGQLGDSAGAMADFTAVIEMPNAPPDHIAQALNNRGVTKGQLGDSAGAMEDLVAAQEAFEKRGDGTGTESVRRAIEWLRERPPGDPKA